MLKTAGSAIADFWRERRAASRQRRRDVLPRIERDRTYAAVRAWATAIQLDLQVAAVVGDVLDGRPVIYTTFLAYDEVAHHSGIERADALEVLAKVDREIGRIESVLPHAPRPYELVVLSDHGQSQGATFLQRYGLTLEQLVEQATARETAIHSESGGEDEASAYLGAGLTELRRDDTQTARTVGAMTRGRVRRRRRGHDRRLERARQRRRPGARGRELPEVSVMASGNLGLISFPREPGRVPLERIDELHPELIGALRSHPGIGWVLVRSAEHGALVLGAEGMRSLELDGVSGEDPLRRLRPERGRAPAAAPTASSTAPTSSSTAPTGRRPRRWPPSRSSSAPTAASAGRRAIPFLCHPARLEMPAEPIVGAEQVHACSGAGSPSSARDAYAD